MESISEQASDAQQLNILIVDDEPMLRSVIQEFLLMLGFERFQIAGDGLEALNRLREERFDCMISDIRMPEMELEEVLDVVRQEMPELVVIATSGFNDFSSAFNIMLKGADDFLGKPLNLDSLELSLTWLAERRALLREALALAQAPEEEFAARLAQMEPLLLNERSAFPAVLRHALRVARLLQAFDIDLPVEDRRRLQLASVVHELGLSCQLNVMCQQARRLEDQEYELVLHSTRNNGERMANALGEPALAALLSHHLSWAHITASEWEQADAARRGSVWLGIANSIDGLLHDRPDRPARTTASVRQWLEERHKSCTVPPLQAVLEQWDRVEQFYAHPPL